MSNSNYFQMNVIDVFHFSDGRVVFTGEIEGPDFIRHGTCELIVEGKLLETFVIDGEMITEIRTDMGKRIRSISTRKLIKIDFETVTTKSCVVRSIKGEQ